MSSAVEQMVNQHPLQQHGQAQLPQHDQQQEHPHGGKRAEQLEDAGGVSVPRRGPWSANEDKSLMKLIDDHGPHNWVRISNMLGTRTPKQCRERFHQNLKPTLNHEPITEEEGIYIEQLVQQYGKKWAEIARRLNGRSDNAVKNWWNGGANRRRRKPPAAHLRHHRPRRKAGPASSPGAPGAPPAPQGPPGPQPLPQGQGPQPAQAPGPQPPSVVQQYIHPLGYQQQPPPYSATQAAIASQSAYPDDPGPLSSESPPHERPAQPAYSSNFLYSSTPHRVSLPNIFSDAYKTDPQSHPLHQVHGQPLLQPPQPQPQPQPQNQPGVVFNSAYTNDSSGFRKSSSAAVLSVDPHHRAPNVPSPSQHSRTGSSQFSRRRAHLTFNEDLFSPYGRRASAASVVTSTGASSRTSSIGGISSASDNEDPLGSVVHSLGKYSLQNGSNSRRNSHIVPDHLPGSGSAAASAGPTAPQNPQNPVLPPLQNINHRHSIAGYPVARPLPVSANADNAAIAAQAVAKTIPAPTPTAPDTPTLKKIASEAPDSAAEPAGPKDSRLKISNLLS